MGPKSAIWKCKFLAGCLVNSSFQVDVFVRDVLYIAAQCYSASLPPGLQMMHWVDAGHKSFAKRFG